MSNISIWGSVDDPAKHSEDKFRYLIHAFNPFASSSMGLINARLALAKQKRGVDYKIDPSHGDQTINLYEQPERVAQRVSLSMSLIDQDHTGTWGDGGIIVEVPEENIVATGDQDMGAMNSDPEFLKQQFASSVRYNGDELLQLSAPSSYNEVIALANVDGSKIKLKGFFIKTDSKGEPLNETVARKMRMHASRLGLPIVTVKKPRLYANNEVEDKGDKLAVHLDGNRYLLSGYGDSNFKFYDEKLYDYFISPEQMQAVLTFMQAEGYDDNYTTALLADYEQANQEYFRAKLFFDDDGQVDSIKKIEGYGKHQTEYVIGAKGYAHVVNKEMEMKRIEESMLGDGTRMIGFDDDYVYRPMSRYQAENLIAEASDALTEDQQEIVQKWSAEILPDLETKSQQNYGRRRDTFSNGFFKFNLT